MADRPMDLESGSSASTSKLLSDREAERADERRHKYKEAGREWFDRAMQASSLGADPFHPAQHKAGPKLDQDFAAFGEAFNQVKVPLFLGVLVLMQAAQPILVQNSLRSMRAPAVLSFLHMLSSAVALWVASSYELPTQRLQIDKLQLNLQGLKGAAVPAAIGALQMLCMFSALHHTSVLMVLSWMIAGEQLLEVGANFVLLGQIPALEAQKLLSAAAGAVVLELFWDLRSWLGLLMLLLWTACKAADVAWSHLKADPHAGGRIASFYIAGVIREYSDEGDALKASTMAFLSNALPAGPVLLLGFFGLEGRELASHEPSVPAVSAMLLACGCHVLTTCAALLLDQKLQEDWQLQPVLKAATAAGTILLLYFRMGEVDALSFIAVLCTAVAAGSALMFSMKRKQ